MDPKRNPRSLEAGGDVLVVAERLVLGLAAAAKGRARQGLDGPVFVPDLDLSAHQQGPVAYRRDGGRSVGILLRSSVEPPVEECAARATLHDVRHRVRARRVGEDPRPPVELKDLALAAQTFGDVDADVEVEADLYIFPVIHLAHSLTIVA